MTDYKKPVVVGCDDVAEGVYAASGCYTVTTNIHRDRSLAGAITEFRLMQDMIQVIHAASSF